MSELVTLDRPAVVTPCWRRALLGLTVAGVLGVAALLRLGWPGVNSFAFDEARLSLIALDMARGGIFASVGMPSSAGVPNLPAAAWVYALPYALSADPLLATLFTGLLGVLTVGLTGWLASRAWGPWAGVWAALFLAASPYAVLYSRSIWAQDLLPPLGMVWAASAYAAVQSRRPRALILHSFVAGFAFQIHFAGAAFAIGTLWLIARFGWWRQWRSLLLGGLLAAAMALPFVVEVVTRRPDLVDAFRAALGGGAQIDGSAFAALVQLAAGHEWGYMVTGRWDTVSQNAFYAALSLAICALGTAALMLGLRRRATAAPLPEIALALLLSGPLFFTRHSTPVFIHYLLASLPALALGVGAAAAVRPRVLRAALALALVGVCATAFVWLGQSLTLAGAVETPGGLGTPLSISRAVAYGVPSDRPALFFTHGGDPLQDGEAAVFAALWYGRGHRIIGGDSLLVLPPQPSTLIATLAPFQAWEELTAAGLTDGAFGLPRRAGEGVLPFMQVAYDGQQTPAGFEPLEAAVPFSDGARLLGWKVRWVGDRLRCSTLWQVEALPPAGRLQQFHHLRDDETLEGDFRLGSDVPLHSQQWQVGDRLIVMADFDGAALGGMNGPLWLDVGHYVLDSLQRVPLAGGGDHVRLGPLSLPDRG